MTAPLPTMLDPDTLLRAYASGVFPMAESAASPDIFWVEPKRRGVLPLDGFHLSKSLAKTLKSERFTLTADRAFDAVLAACAEPVPGRADTWINPVIAAVTVPKEEEEVAPATTVAPAAKTPAKKKDEKQNKK